jgi:hypothetical protein
MLPTLFDPALPKDEWTQNQALDRAATGIDYFDVTSQHFRRLRNAARLCVIQISRGRGFQNRKPGRKAFVVLFTVKQNLIK